MILFFDMLLIKHQRNYNDQHLNKAYKETPAALTGREIFRDSVDYRLGTLITVLFGREVSSASLL